MMVVMIMLSELAILSSVAIEYFFFSRDAFPIPTNQQLPCPFLRLIWKKYSRCEGKQDTGYARFVNAIDRTQAADRPVESTYGLTRSSPETTTNGGFKERKISGMTT